MAQKRTSKARASSGAVTKNRTDRRRLTRRELQEISTFAKGLARASGALAMSYYGRANPTLRFDFDLVTEADLALQEFIHKEIGGTYPDHQFLRQGADEPDGREPLWVVDPLDGSAGFSAGMPVWGVSLALFDGDRPVLGIIHLPVTGELYSAVAGGPAMLNDRPIAVLDQAVDNESLLLTYSRFHADFATHLTGKVRSLGSTAAHIAYVARGAASAAVLGNVHVWDLAAGAVLLEAAGGTLRDLDGKKVELGGYLDGVRLDRVVLAAPKGLHREIASLLERR